MVDLIVLNNDREAKWLQLKSLALAAVSSAHSKRAYEGALDAWRAWHESSGEPARLFSKASVHKYRESLEGRGLAPSTINVQLSAIRRLCVEAADNGLIAPELAAGIARVRSVPRHTTRMGNWLTVDQAQDLLDAPDRETLTGKRDRAILGVLIGCALRRSEAATLTFEHIQQREGRWVIVDLVGKGRRFRTIPIQPWVKVLIDEWATAAGISSGFVFRAINRGGHIVGEKLSNARPLWIALRRYSSLVLPGMKLAPHDLRRTCAKLCRQEGGELEQIQMLLGHSSVQTTERYLGTKQDLVNGVNDRVRFRVAAASAA
jgi:integrase